ncbi:hypothetical protein ONV78_16005 [Hahella sp. CR1]|uniref:hypothetical protein n=1 Tax=Hahella sp. CR1 TaxID=2992807 RepID=UPI002441EAAC|nr:hypothetical protein [Hahella sp. CR1]MDG9669246.1 hypothetical protein [Hahella sp. CR1]
MNATHELSDHLEASENIANVSQLAGVVASLPQNASTTHYGADGKQIASYSKTSYANLKLSPQGDIQGGTLSHSATDANGNALNSSTLAFANGNVATAKTQINNRFASGVAKQVEADFSNVKWTPATTIHSGQVKFTSRRGDSQSLRSDGVVTYANELITSGSFRHYSPEGQGGVEGYTDIDYSNTKFVGDRIIGGYFSVSSKNAARAENSQSNVFMNASGAIDQIHTKNFDPASAAMKSQVLTEFQNTQFNARNEIDGGEAHYSISDPNGVLQNKTVVTYQNGVPSNTVTQNYANNQVLSKVVSSYEGATFDNELRAINSTVHTREYNAAEKLMSMTDASYNASGAPTKIQSRTLDPDTQTPLFLIETDYANTQFNYRRKPIGGHAKITTTNLKDSSSIETIKTFTSPTAASATAHAEELMAMPTQPSAPQYLTHTSTMKNAEGQTTAYKKTITRSDGSLLKTVVTNVTDDKPTSVAVTLYAADGKTVAKTYAMDVSGVAVSAGKVSGAMKITTKFRGQILSSESTLEF